MNKNLLFSLLLLFSFLITVNSCTNSSKPNDQETQQSINSVTSKISQNSTQYMVLDEEKSETIGKAQLIEYALYKDTVYTEDALRDVVMEIYNLNKDKNVFENHDGPTVVAVYLFTSEDSMKDKSNWIAMLVKSPNETVPTVSFNGFKVTALRNLNDNVKSEDEIELEKINSYLKKRGLELCSLSDLLKKIELENIHQADAKYPDYGDKHMAMTDRLDAQSYKDLQKKYKLGDDVLGKVSSFAMLYCK